MTTVLKNFVVVKKTRGDVLHPATYRSTVEMINGIIKQGDYTGFKESYKSFINHLIDYNDPHKVTNVGFLEEVIEYIYSIYVYMTPTPLNEEDFRLFIVPTISFFELMKRIFLNRWLYLKIKNTDGSLPQTFVLDLPEDWGISDIGSNEVSYTFPTIVTSEQMFIQSGWNNITTPRPVVFNALDITSNFTTFDSIFHTSTASPYETVIGSAFGYPVNITGSSNDINVKVIINKSPTQDTTLLSLLNLNNTLTIVMSDTSTVTISLNNTVIFNNISCNDNKLILSISKNGLFRLTVFNDGVLMSSSATVDLTTVGILTTAVIGIPLENPFEDTFGARDISIYKTSSEIGEVPTILPLIIYTPQSSVVPLINTVTVSGISQVFFPQLGYKLYLTLSGSWTGTVSLQISRDGGSTWGVMTSSGIIVGSYSENCDESVGEVYDYLVRFRLVYTVISGSLTYRLAQ